ncbi:MAG: DUF3276 family protein [Lewinellaceae bacterium]|nr:DUF3276 family protein [Saprospiraceae bacterium]MCB9336853.1 DUF3276 family protein [Lewinellaceae bacterium]
MDKDRRFDSVYSKKVRAGKRRTYFFDVRRTKGDDFYLTLTESTKKFHGDSFERHKIFLYKEDFNRFLNSLEEVIDYIKTELMPDYDYEEFDRRHDEWDARRTEEDEAGDSGFKVEKGRRNQPSVERNNKDDDDDLEEVNENEEFHEDDDMSW